MYKLIIVIMLLLLTMLFLATYEGIWLSYYEETTADCYTYYVGIPLILYVSIGFFLEKRKYSLKDNRLWDAFKYSLSGFFGFAILYFFFVTPVLSGTILMTNDLLGGNKKKSLTGIITEISSTKSSKHGNHELTIQTADGAIILDTYAMEIEKYKLGDSFKEEMNIGCWGLWYKRR